MTVDREKLIADRAKLFQPRRHSEVRRVAVIAVAALVMGGGYIGWQNAGSLATAVPRVAIPAATEGPNAAPSPTRPLFADLPEAPVSNEPTALERQIEALSSAIAALDTRITEIGAEQTAPVDMSVEITALKESNKTLAKEFRAILEEEATNRESERERQAAMEDELSVLRERESAQLDQDSRAEAGHRRELERLRLEHELTAKEQLEQHRLDAARAAREHEQRKELKAIEAREAERLRLETEREKQVQQDKETAREAVEAERVRRISGGIAIDDTPDQIAARSNDSETARSGAANLQSKSPSSTISEGTLITGILETAIQSDLPGAIRAVVSEPVWSEDASRILIPKGSRLIGRYESEIAQGQSRVLVAWSRVKLPNGNSISLDALGTDGLGRAGLGGYVDRHFATTFEAAFLISAVSAISNLGSNAKFPNEIVNAAIANGSVATSEGTDDALGGYLAVPPTIHVNQATPITVFVQRDLSI